MDKQVPYLPEEAIERDAEVLLSEYEHARNVTITPPVPIEDIVEKHLKLRVEFDDTHKMFGVPRLSTRDADILGAIFFDEARIVIDESLDPEENPAKEGRYRFTLAHEGGGHWRLHRCLFTTNAAQIALFDQAAAPSFICRLSQAKEPVEWQADFHASCTLMPRKLVFAVWDEMFPDRKPRVLRPITPIDHPFTEIARSTCGLPGAELTESEDATLDHFAHPFAERFLVSPIAMRIRLEKLGLLHRVVPLQRFLASGS
jgi:Zn-dependent peptidase ImmA (M78 family)